MSEELENALDVNEETSNEEVEVSPVEEKAMSQGWRPEEEWEGDPDQWVDAKTFVRNGEFMQRIQEQTKRLNSRDTEIEELKSAIKALGEHNKKIAEAEYNKAIRDLKKEKVAALEEDDHAAVVEIDDKIDELKEAKKETASSKTEDKPVENERPIPNEVFQKWVDQNDWYKTDRILMGAADAIGLEYAESHAGAPPQEVFAYVTKRIKEEFPHKFGNKNQDKPSSVTEAGGSGKRTKKTKYTVKDLSDEQRQFGKTFVDTGAFDSMQEYVDQLAEAGEL